MKAPTGATQLTAVIGSPVRHSLSPTLHNAAFAAAERDWVMLAFEVAPGSGAAAVDAMRTLGLRGMAVTMPHKTDVAAAVDDVDPAARVLDSVNTVVLRADGTTFGTSTDGQGFVGSLLERGIDPAGARIALLGAGAAARALIDALGRAGVADLAIVNRTAEHARQASELAAQARVGDTDDIRNADIVVNATPVGMGTDELPCDPALLGPRQIVADLVYHPLETALLQAARDAGARGVGGLAMLVHQAVLQHELWTGERPDPDVMRLATEGELVRRHG
ncbi:MAG TPA: shikimate dehydrogenase [Ilumatobacteraceae bacterium]|nr:shikimate dehydrogenase [Ilumatobacteraceae bacterium]